MSFLLALTTMSGTTLAVAPIADFTIDGPTPFDRIHEITLTSTTETCVTLGTCPGGFEEIIEEQWRVVHIPTSTVILNEVKSGADVPHSSVSFTPTDLGDHRLRLRVVDDDGEVDVKVVIITVENLAPLVALDADQYQGGFRDHDVQPVAIQPNTPVRVQDNSIDLDGTIVTSEMDATGSGSLVSITPGSTQVVTFTDATCTERTLALEVTDDNGEMSATSLDIIVDPTMPTLTAATPTPDGNNGWFVSSPVTVTYQATEDCTGIEYVAALDSNDFPVLAATPSTSGSMSVSEDGTNDLTFETRDFAHNTVTQAVAVPIDTTAPSISLTSPCLPLAGCALGLGTTAIAGDVVNIDCDASDATSGLDSVEYFVDGVQLATGDCSAPVQWTAAGGGFHTIEVVAFDVAGNSATASIDLLVIG